MKVLNALLVTIATAAVAVEAGRWDALMLRHNHYELTRRSDGSTNKMRRRTCKPNQKSTTDPNNASKPPPAPAPAPAKSAPPAPSPTPPAGVINVESSCGNPGATPKTTAKSGPNGNIDWMNCGINSGGWKPPHVTTDDLIMGTLSDAVKDPNSPFHQCSSFISLFNKYGAQFNVPPILLASISLQESRCQPDTPGGGLMQISSDKCTNAPGGNCNDPNFNIQEGARFFSQTLAANKGNVFATLGNYNGWPLGMTFQSATAARYSGCCACQNNLDYLDQVFNGWMQNVNVDSHVPKIGAFFNLDACS